MLEEMLTGHWSSVAGAHFRLPYLLVELVCLQSVVLGSRLQQDGLLDTVPPPPPPSCPFERRQKKENLTVTAFCLLVELDD